LSAGAPGFGPVLLALGAALFFGISTLVAKRGLLHVEAQTGALVSIATTFALYTLLAPLWMRAADWFTPGFWVFVLNGLMHPMLSMYLALEATARTGPTIAATFSATAPLFATLTAILFLDETLSLVVASGTLATIGGIVTFFWRPIGGMRLLRAALLFATGAAVIRGLNHTVGKIGLELLPNAFMAAFVSFGVSLIGSLLVYRLRRRRLPLGIPRLGLLHFVPTGLLIGVAVLCMYGALASGSVVVVSPIVATYPLFTLLGGLLIGHEALTRRLLAGTLLVVAGVVLIGTG